MASLILSERNTCFESSQWTQLLQSARSAVTDPSETDANLSIAVLVESWILSPDTPYEHISEAIDGVLAKDIQNISANTAKVFDCLDRGGMLSAKRYAEACASHYISTRRRPGGEGAIWSNFKGGSATTKDPPSPTKVINALALFAAVMTGMHCGFYFFSVQDMLCSTEDAYHICDALVSVYYAKSTQSGSTAAGLRGMGGVGMRNGMREQLRLARVRALTFVNQIQTATADACRLLPYIFVAIESSCEEKLSVIDTAVVAASPIVQWTVLKTLVDLNLHDTALRLTEALLGVHGITDVDGIPVVQGNAWIFSERAHAMLLKLSLTKRGAVATSSGCVRPCIANTLLYPSCQIEESACTQIIRQLQAVTKAASVPPSSSAVRASLFCPELDPEVRIRIGLAMWLSGGKLRKDKNGCLAFLSAGAKGDPYHRSVYGYLGHYCLVELKDFGRAEQFYLKAIQINPVCEEAGMGLSLLYLSRSDQSGVQRAQALWRRVLSESSHAHWCHSLRGRFLHSRGEFEAAIEDFQRALELQPSDAGCWLGLGACYASFQQSASACKALARASELCPRDCVVMDVWAEELRKLCSLPEALALFERAISVRGISDSPGTGLSFFVDLGVLAVDTVGAAYIAGHQENKQMGGPDAVSLKGMADVCMMIAYEQLAQGRTAAAARSVRQSIDSARTLLSRLRHQPGDSCASVTTSATTTEGEAERGEAVLCVLKLLGDAACLVYYLGPDDVDATFSFPFPVIGSEPGEYARKFSVDSKLYAAQLSVLTQGEEAFQEIVDWHSAHIEVTQAADRAAAFLDLGCSLYFQANVILFSSGQGAGLVPTPLLSQLESVSALFSRAKAVFVTGLRIDPLNSALWNALGLVLKSGSGDDEVRLKEACFMRSAQIDGNSAAYANLANTLILQARDEEARECLGSVQQMESNPMVWVTMGTLFERGLRLPDASSNLSRSSNSKNASAKFEEVKQASNPVAEFDASKRQLHEILIHDAYTAALEVAKPCEAFLGAALSWLRLHGCLITHYDGTQCLRDPDILRSMHLSGYGLAFGHASQLPSSSHMSASFVWLDICELKHEVESNLTRYLYIRPTQPVAWIALAWCSEVRGKFTAARLQWIKALGALDRIAAATRTLGTLPLESIELFKQTASMIFIAFKRNSHRSSPLESSDDGLLLDSHTPHLRELFAVSHEEPAIVEISYMQTKWPQALDSNCEVKQDDDTVSAAIGLLCGLLSNSTPTEASGSEKVGSVEDAILSFSLLRFVKDALVRRRSDVGSPISCFAKMRDAVQLVLDASAVSVPTSNIALAYLLSRNPQALLLIVNVLKELEDSDGVTHLLHYACEVWCPESALLWTVRAEYEKERETGDVIAHASTALSLCTRALHNSRKTDDQLVVSEETLFDVQNAFQPTEGRDEFDSLPALYCRASILLTEKSADATSVDRIPAEAGLSVSGVDLDSEARRQTLRGLHLYPCNQSAWKMVAAS